MPKEKYKNSDWGIQFNGYSVIYLGEILDMLNERVTKQTLFRAHYYAF